MGWGQRSREVSNSRPVLGYICETAVFILIFALPFIVLSFVCVF